MSIREELLRAAGLSEDNLIMTREVARVVCGMPQEAWDSLSPAAQEYCNKLTARVNSKKGVLAWPKDDK